MTLTRDRIAQAVADATGMDRRQASAAVRVVFDSLVGGLMEGGRIEIRDFGSFEVITRGPRSARNPRTGETLRVPERRVVRYRCGTQLRRAINRESARV